MLNLMGAILAKTGKGPEAATHWEKALKADPGMLPARLNLARHLRHIGEKSAATAHFRKAAAQDPHNLEIARELSSLLLEASQYREALTHLNLALEQSPRNARLLNARAGCLASLGRFQEAANQYETVLRDNPGYWQARYNYALLLSNNGRHPDSEEHCRMLAEKAPDFLGGLSLWAENLARLGRFGQAAQVLERCLLLDPGSAALRSMYGVALMRLGRPERAEEQFKQSLEINPGHAAAHQNLAALLSRSLRYGEALEPALAGLKLAPGSIELALIASKCLLHTQGPEKADSFLEGFRSRMQSELLAAPPGKLGDLHLETADLKDRLGKSREAFEHAQAGNRQKAKLIQPWLQEARLFKSQISQLKELYQGKNLEVSKPSCNSDSIPPVFLVGFPRSGTTLLKQILDTHSRISALEEKPAFQFVREAMAKNLDGGFPGGLAKMGPAEKKRYASMYREDVAKRAGAEPGVMILDKSPLDMAFAGPINLLFPNAKFILMARHPLDACLSCFMRNFNLQGRTVEFVSLEATVELYQRVFDLWRVYAGEAGLDFHLIRYEDLVADMPGRTKAVLEYLGLDWEESILNYRKGMRYDGQTQSISQHQVAEPIYKRAKFRWQRYAGQLEPFFSRLAPYCLRLGYADPRPGQ